MRACERCGGLTVFLRLFNGAFVCKACTVQSEREAARARHPAGKHAVLRQKTA